MKHIVVKEEVKEKLDGLKLTKWEPYNEVIERLLKNAEPK